MMESMGRTLLGEIALLNKKKIELLDDCYDLIQQQRECFETDEFQEETFEDLQGTLDGKLQEMEKVIEDYDLNYARLLHQKDQMKQPEPGIVEELMQLDRKVAQRTRRLTEAESEIKLLFQNYISKERRKAKEYAGNQERARTYYQSMVGQVDAQGFLYDQKG